MSDNKLTADEWATLNAEKMAAANKKTLEEVLAKILPQTNADSERDSLLKHYVAAALGSGKTPEHSLRIAKEAVALFYKVLEPNQANATDCLFMFGAWLTSLEEPITFSSKHDAGQMVRLLECFITENNLPDVSIGYPDNLKQPPALGGTAAPTLVNMFGSWLRSDNETAWTWHCQLAVAMLDEGVSHAKANERARHLMKQLFGCWDYYTEFYKEAEFKLEPSNYYWATSEHAERTLVYYYMYKGTLGFGFNIADGGGFVPATDFTYASIEAL